MHKLDVKSPQRNIKNLELVIKTLMTLNVALSKDAIFVTTRVCWSSLGLADARTTLPTWIHSAHCEEMVWGSRVLAWPFSSREDSS